MFKKKIIVSKILIFLVSLTLFSQNDDIQILRNNLINDALQNQGFSPRTGRYIVSDFSRAEEYLNSMKLDGSWSDVDYMDRDNKWSPLWHLDKILVMTINYENSTSALYQDQALLDGLERSLNYWYQVNPECDNWYKNRIAKQFYFNVIGLLLQGKIDDSLHSRMVNDLTEKPSMTGSNRTLVAISTFNRGVIENNPERVKLGVTGVTDQIVVTDKEGIHRLKDPRWVWHDSVGYIFPDDEPVNIKADLQKGNIQRMYGLGKDTVYSHEVFSLWFDHGLKPMDESYQYIVVPGVNSKELARYAKKLPLTILSNTKNVQAVSHDDLKITGIVFHQAGEFAFGKDLVVAVDHPGLVLLNKGMITVSDPTAALKEITITLNKGDGSIQTKRVKLPTEGFAGKSVSLKID